MISAEEARTQSENRKSEMQKNFEEDQLKFIENGIREAIDRGKCELELSRLSAATYRYAKIEIFSLAYKLLKENGYLIEENYEGWILKNTIIKW